MKYNIRDDLQEHYTKYDKISRELKNLGANFQESDIACFLLLSMPAEYESVVTAIRTISDDDLQLSIVKNRLLEFKTVNRNASKPEAAFIVTKLKPKCSGGYSGGDRVGSAYPQ